MWKTIISAPKDRPFLTRVPGGYRSRCDLMPYQRWMFAVLSMAENAQYIAECGDKMQWLDSAEIGDDVPGDDD